MTIVVIFVIIDTITYRWTSHLLKSTQSASVFHSFCCNSMVGVLRPSFAAASAASLPTLGKNKINNP